MATVLEFLILNASFLLVFSVYVSTFVLILVFNTWSMYYTVYTVYNALYCIYCIIRYILYYTVYNIYNVLYCIYSYVCFVATSTSQCVNLENVRNGKVFWVLGFCYKWISVWNGSAIHDMQFLDYCLLPEMQDSFNVRIITSCFDCAV